jgi:hypothetical protein
MLLLAVGYPHAGLRHRYDDCPLHSHLLSVDPAAAELRINSYGKRLSCVALPQREEHRQAADLAVRFQQVVRSTKTMEA